MCIYHGIFDSPITIPKKLVHYKVKLFERSRYCGEYTDIESGLVYLRWRYYSPMAGRFLNEDPIRDGMNWYAYCGSNPVNYWDPSGYYRVQLSTLQVALEHGVDTSRIRMGLEHAWAVEVKAETYALNNEPRYTEDGVLITWDNVADAYRHFTWNYEMAADPGMQGLLLDPAFGFNAALKISTAHEISYLRRNDMVTYTTDASSNQRNAFMPLEMLMDLWNNRLGAVAAYSGLYTSADEAFEANSFSITNLDQVAGRYGFNTSEETIGPDKKRGFNVTFTYSGGLVSDIQLQSSSLQSFQHPSVGKVINLQSAPESANLHTTAVTTSIPTGHPSIGKVKALSM